MSTPHDLGDAPDASSEHANKREARQRRLLRLLSLRRDQADDAAIDATIRDNARIGGTNLWVLIFAMLIASVGLNVNSTAVIIGAMLISPLMGPIIGIGYGAGVHDYALIRQCFRNLVLFVGISLLASTVYFLVTPLKTAHSELFARTSPTLWDVLIAFFGGAAGMIGLTRKEKTTLLPGVAIATALMPPICTAGYGLATGQPRFFLGAFYLFLINAVFIALATLAITRILRLPHRTFASKQARLRGRIFIGAATVLTLVPSIYLAVRLVEEEVFSARANELVAKLASERADVSVVGQEVDAQRRTIRLTLIGQGVTPALEHEFKARLDRHGLANATLTLRHPSEGQVDLPALREEVRKDALRAVIAASNNNTQRLVELQRTVAGQEALLKELVRVEQEIQVQLPGLRAVRASARAQTVADGAKRTIILVAVDLPTGLAPAEHERLKRWLSIRLPDAASVELVVGRFDSGTPHSTAQTK